MVERIRLVRGRLSPEDKLPRGFSRLGIYFVSCVALNFKEPIVLLRGLFGILTILEKLPAIIHWSGSGDICLYPFRLLVLSVRT